ncbi:hypothetical protein [Pseudomonas sp. UMAB-08]|uniref:hypothetical protein n=1 Tax=Pseudomonas sp. UMAB-08 TaxID=1365375 RepID=UPI001C575067|nr:hypothetical protein [Pseudomonas sp. UMAB-08]
MSLKIESSHTDLASLIDEIQKINEEKGEEVSVVTIAEFQAFRDKADREVEKVTDLSVQESLGTLQRLADEFVQALQLIALAARKSKLSASKNKLSFASKDPVVEAENAAKKLQVAALKKAAEYQLTYAVLGYKSSVELL